MKIITHRGLDYENNHSFTESSRGAFQFFLDKGFGLEFDVQITKDGVPVISHDSSLSRVAKHELPAIADQTVSEFLGTKLPNGNTLTLETLIAMLYEAKQTTNSVHALHLKTSNQTEAGLLVLLPFLAQLTDLPIMVFDATPAVGRKIKKQIGDISLAASVAHPYDVARYNGAVGGTLLTLKDMETYRDIYDWAWLDEWDRTDENGTKALYTAETFATLRALGYKLALVSPELHATSPKLLGGESHQDAANFESLKARWDEVAAFKPDAICTDYPFCFSSYE